MTLEAAPSRADGYEALATEFVSFLVVSFGNTEYSVVRFQGATPPSRYASTSAYRVLSSHSSSS